MAPTSNGAQSTMHPEATEQVDLGAFELSHRLIRRVLARLAEEPQGCLDCQYDGRICMTCACDVVLEAVERNPYLLTA